MGEIRVFFWGVCTYMDRIQPSAPASDAWGNRYVLVDASNPATIHNSSGLKGRSIAPHFAEMQIVEEDIVTISDTTIDGFSLQPDVDKLPPLKKPVVVWSLNNVILSIANPAQPAVQAEVPPGLHSLSKFINGTMPPPSFPITLNTVPTLAACYFDFFTGSLECVAAEGGASIGMLTVKTIGDPQIRVRSFNAQPTTPAIAIHLQSESEVVVSNLPPSPVDDSDHDFLLHYLTASKFPDVNLKKLPPPDSKCNPIKTYNLPRGHALGVLGSSCSNSTYP